MLKTIKHELKEHAPFTIFGALAGILFIFLFRNLSKEVSHELFFVFHPLHVLLSALVTASIYELHACPKGSGKKCNLPLLLIIGFIGSIGIATLSDSIMPYIGEVLLDMPHRHHHIGFLEKWWLISGVAVVGIIIAYFNPSTKFPHAAHVLISTWASLFHILMAKGQNISVFVYVIIFIFLFFAVWLPCCISDIVFPLLFIKKRSKKGVEDGHRGSRS
ncbi:MAG: hypothetical protein KAJ14_06980 [Candidatus Omnitrophica bacterium]|nr:hypothetical protein [Candidatus Omnitrophota bacterium]MCK5492835.1 hypothetical protein [Candidatus Omnitrophota bacterium]